jgi:hypothetical protein
MAWTRFDFMAGLQRHTFVPLWLGYILTVNAATHWRGGECMLASRPRLLALLFPASALFWWGFEYLNRFVENWLYHGHGADGAWAYGLLATLAFSTVLPAVLSTRDFLATFPRMYAPFAEFLPVPEVESRGVAAVGLAIGLCALLLLGVLPNLTYPFLWLAPLLVLASARVLRGYPSVFRRLRAGDWREVVLLALATLACGVFWELWNVFSLAKWTYQVPYVHALEIFEMPLPGYLGYLPFGLECGIVAELAFGRRALYFDRLADTSTPTATQG